MTAAASPNLVGFLVGLLLGGVVAAWAIAYFLLRDVGGAAQAGTLDAEPEEGLAFLTPRQRLRWSYPIYLVLFVWSSAGVAAGLALRSVAITVCAAISLVVAVVALTRIKSLASRLPHQTRYTDSGPIAH